MADIRIGVVGAGVIGMTHIDAILCSEGFRLAGIVDPAASARDTAAAAGAPHFADLAAMIDGDGLDGVVVATPNELHVPISVAAIEAGLPVLVEKPIANSVHEAMVLLDAVERTGVPVLVGHHRRHNPIVRAAKAAIDDGLIGKLVTASVICSLYKDAAYFDTPWRRTPGVGGPLLINLIHEVDLMRHLFGDVASVSAMSSTAQRNLPVEDTAAAVLRFEKGGMAQMTVSDAAVGPWAWDISAGENLARFPAHPIQSHLFAGTEAGMSLPDLAVWSHEGEKSWTKTLRRRLLPAEPEDCYQAQLRHFGEVIAGRARPLVSAIEGTKDLATVLAIGMAAGTSRETEVESVSTHGAERKRAS